MASSNANRRERAVSAQFAEILVDNITDYAIYGLADDGTIISWNTGACRLKGYRSDEIIGRNFSVFYTPEDLAAGLPEKLLAEARREGRVELEGWRVRKDGSRFWADVVMTTVRDPSGAHIGFAKVTRDLSERRAAEEALRQSEERLRLMVGSVKDYAIFMLDERGHVRSWNAGAERIKGYTEEEIVGSHITRFYPPEDVAAGLPLKLLEEAKREGRVESEGWRVRKDGTRFWADVVITALRDRSGKLVGFTKVTRDLSDRRLAETERLRLVQVQEALRLRDEFLAIAAHELKTPLTAIRLQLRLLRDAAAADPKVNARIESALRSTGRLGDLIERLLDVSLIAEGKLALEREQMDLAEVVSDVVDRLAPSAQLSNTEVTAKVESVTGSWDRIRLEQVITNLLSNAVKYGAGTEVEVQVFRRDDRAVLQIEDRGPGIPEDARSRLFGRFERAAPVEKYGGLGLGLYITREIVVAHGGTVRAENVAPQGARFTVELPL